MGVFTIYLFSRQGTCLFYHEWSRPKPVKLGAGTPSDDQKMLFGLFFQLKVFAAAMDPKGEPDAQLGAPLRIGDTCSFQSFTTDNYKLHFAESPSGLKIVLTTDPTVGSLKDQLAYIYNHIYVETIIKNPLYLPGQPFNCDSFSEQLNQYIRSLGLL